MCFFYFVCVHHTVSRARDRGECADTQPLPVPTHIFCVHIEREKVGDSLAHDIVGASAAGVDSVFIAGGICGEELGVDAKADKATFKLTPEALEKVFARESVTPTWTMPLFAL